MKTKQKKIAIKKGIVLFLMLAVLAFLVKVNYGVVKAYRSVSEVSSTQKQKEKLLEERQKYLEEKKRDLETGYGKEKELVDKFGVKKPGEKVIVIIP